jgi:glucose-1-phosphate cytidylyltransferase
MKAVILCGGLGTRLAEETELKPKPMVEIGGRPILWNILKHYAHYGFREFALALGYKSDFLKRYFLESYHLESNLTVHLDKGQVNAHEQEREDRLVHLVDTGDKTQTGGRVKRLTHLLDNETFMLTYGDGVCNVNLQRLLDFHSAHGKLATVTPPMVNVCFIDLTGVWCNDKRH